MENENKPVEDEKKPAENKLSEEASLVILIFIILAAGLVGFLIGLEMADPELEDASENTIYSVYQVDQRWRTESEYYLDKKCECSKIRKINYPVGFAMVSDPDDNYRIIFLGRNCMKNYRSGANLLITGSGDSDSMSCQWLTAKETPPEEEK